MSQRVRRAVVAALTAGALVLATCQVASAQNVGLLTLDQVRWWDAHDQPASAGLLSPTSLPSGSSNVKGCPALNENYPGRSTEDQVDYAKHGELVTDQSFAYAGTAAAAAAYTPLVRALSRCTTFTEGGLSGSILRAPSRRVGSQSALFMVEIYGWKGGEFYLVFSFATLARQGHVDLFVLNAGSTGAEGAATDLAAYAVGDV